MRVAISARCYRITSIHGRTHARFQRGRSDPLAVSYRRSTVVCFQRSHRMEFFLTRTVAWRRKGRREGRGGGGGEWEEEVRSEGGVKRKKKRRRNRKRRRGKKRRGKGGGREGGERG